MLILDWRAKVDRARVRDEVRRDLAAANRAPWTRTLERRRAWDLLVRPQTVDRLSRGTGLTRAAAGAWMSKALRAGVVLKVGTRARRHVAGARPMALYVRAPRWAHAINFPPVPRAPMPAGRRKRETKAA